MNDFAFYFDVGFKHIISADALDHQLFIVALAAIYRIANFKAVLILVTAFTVGHTVTLVLAAYDIIRFSNKWVEFLIPLTIVITALFNFFQKEYGAKLLKANYFIALAFGHIHGAGFANTIRFMLAKDQAVALPLLGFNVGLELGQIAVVILILGLNYLMINKAGLPQKWWVRILSGLAFIIAAYICVNRWPA